MIGLGLVARLWRRRAIDYRMPIDALLGVGFVAIDLETTGLDARRDVVVAIAAVPFEDGRPRDGLVTLVNPGRSIPPASTAIHGIDDAAVVGAPFLHEVLPRFEAVCTHRIVVLGQGCVWYSGQFWALYFLQTVKKLDVLTSSWIVGIALLIASPTLIFWGWLSDKIGRKPIILGGMALASLTYYPLYSALGTYANPGSVNYPMSILIVVILVNYVGMTYGPIGAFLAEFFPSRIRYTSVSVPYHIGNGWGGGLVPIVTTSMYLSTGSVGYALIYPIAVPAIMFVLSVFLMPETRKMSIWEPERARA